MSGSLVTRVEKLETKAQPAGQSSFRLIRLCATDAEEAAALAEAVRCGVPEEQVQILKLVPLEPKEPVLRFVE